MKRSRPYDNYYYYEEEELLLTRVDTVHYIQGYKKKALMRQCMLVLRQNGLLKEIIHNIIAKMIQYFTNGPWVSFQPNHLYYTFTPMIDIILDFICTSVNCKLRNTIDVSITESPFYICVPCYELKVSINELMMIRKMFPHNIQDILIVHENPFSYITIVISY